MTKKDIIKYYEAKHRQEVKATKCLIPQTMRGKKIRYILKLIDQIN